MNALGWQEIAFIAGLLTLPLVLVALFVLAWRKRYQVSIQQAVIDKLGSAENVSSFLRTPAGQCCVEGLVARAAPDPVQTALTSIRRGIVCAVLGIGIVVAAWDAGVPRFRNLGLILIFLGAGVIVAALVSRRLAQSWSRENP